MRVKREEVVKKIIEHDGVTEWADCFDCQYHATEGEEVCPECGGKLGLAIELEDLESIGD
jgi:hypothetical protein